MTMPTYMNGELILQGQWIKALVETPFGQLWHHGIIRRVYRNGMMHVIDVVHNTKNGGVVQSSLWDFSNGSKVFLVRRPVSTNHRDSILATADANLSKHYSAVAQNCEHFCSFCYEWEAKSDTVRGLPAASAHPGTRPIGRRA